MSHHAAAIAALIVAALSGCNATPEPPAGTFDNQDEPRATGSSSTATTLETTSTTTSTTLHPRLALAKDAR